MRNLRISCRRRLGRRPIVLALAFVAVALSDTYAHAYQARVRWIPSKDPSVIGYRIYVREGFRTYPAPVYAGKPPLEAYGTMSWVVGGLTSGRTYYFAVSAYSSKLEGSLSGEIAIGHTDPCVIDRCFTRTSCEFGIRDDGASCGDGLCDVCRIARCTTLPPVDLDTVARVERKTSGVRARIRGRFSPAGSVDPGAAGVVVNFADRSGTKLAETVIPASALKANATGRRFRLTARDVVYGVRQFNLSIGSNLVRVSMVVQGYEYEPLADRPDLTWALRFGADQCAVDPALTCTGSRCR